MYSIQNIITQNNKYSSYKCLVNSIKNKYFYISISNKYPLLFDITATKNDSIDYDKIIKNAYKDYEELYDLDDSINLLKNIDFINDTQILHIAIHNSCGYKLKEFEELIQKNKIYKEVFEVNIYELQVLSDLSDKLIEQIYIIENREDIEYIENNIIIKKGPAINYIKLLVSEIKKYVKKYY